MNSYELAELLKYSSPNKLYIITFLNEIVCLNCPFKVIVIKSIGELKSGEIVKVEKVKLTYELIIVFEIRKYLYYYYYFDFLLDD